MTPRTGPRILIIRLSAIGDVIVTTPVPRAIRAKYLDAHIAWVVEDKSAGVLEGHPDVDEVIVWERGGGFRAVQKLVLRLRAQRFDWAVDCQGLIRSALLAGLSGAKRVIGNNSARECAPLFYSHKVPKPEDPSNRQRCLALLQPLGIESADRRMVIGISDAERQQARRILIEEGLRQDERYACLVPATTWPQKHWFEERWGDLAGFLQRRLGLKPVLMGGPADLPMMDRIRAASSVECAVAAGKSGLKVSSAIVEGAAVTIAVDTALMHASVAVGTPTIGVVGPSWWPGFQDYEGLTLVREPLECSPCLRHPTCDGRFDCMRALDAERVFAAVEAAVAPTRQRLPVVP